MRGCWLLFTIAGTVLAQDAPVASVSTVPSGVPLRVALENRVAIKKVGEPIQGRLVEPVYVFDRVALPAGSLVEGHVAEIGGVPLGRRLQAILSGNLTPAREVKAQFDAVVLSDGSRLALRTALSRGTAHTMRVEKPRKRLGASASPLQGVRDRVDNVNRAAYLAFKAPGKLSRLKSGLFAMLPYHRQAWSAGTLFSGVLQESITAPAPASSEAQAEPAVAEAEEQEVSARLLTALDSKTAQRGAAVEAVVTRPLFSPDHRLLIPEGSRLFGDVVTARPAHFLHRNGRLLFVFRRIQLPSGVAQSIQGKLGGLDADFETHMALDSEGVARVASPKTRFLFPAIAVAVAGLSIHQDYNSEGVPDQDIAGRAESGAVGLGLIGTVAAQASRTFASSIAFTGAGFSVYTNFIARGKEVVLPVNTPVRVSLRARGGEFGGSR